MLSGQLGLEDKYFGNFENDFSSKSRVASSL